MAEASDNQRGPRDEAVQLAALREMAQPLNGGSEDYDGLLELVGDARFVLLGESSHGSHEFYRERARLTQRLLADYGFSAVAIEGDWPDSWRVDRYVRGLSEVAGADEALAGFKRFPTWMWRNREVLDFVAWLRSYNDAQPKERKAGFYGLDLYSLSASLEAVLSYLGAHDPEAARRARERYACFAKLDVEEYAYTAGYGLGESCEEEAVAQLVELATLRLEQAVKDGADREELFAAEQNARLVKDAEEYYRMMFRGHGTTWNLRDRHMASTLERVSKFLRAQGSAGKVIVWAHNSHVGDARATEMGEAGEWTLGQLMRESYPDQTRLVGFSTYSGHVTASSDWGGQTKLKQVRPALPDSHEGMLHSLGLPRFWLPMHEGLFEKRRLERAIGVIYRPESERMSHYFYCDLARQFDAVIHIDETHAVHPLEPGERWTSGEVPETYPFAV